MESRYVDTLVTRHVSTGNSLVSNMAEFSFCLFFGLSIVLVFLLTKTWMNFTETMIKKADTKEQILYNSIYVKLKTRKTNL